MTDTNAAVAVNEETRPPENNQQQQRAPVGDDAASNNEARARRMGWRPEEEFDDSMPNRPKKFLTPDEYIEKVEGDLPILRERNRFLDQTVGKFEKQVGDLAVQVKTLLEKENEQGELIELLHKQNVEVGKRAYEKAKRELQAQIDAAVQDGNPEAVRQLTSEMVDLEASKPGEPPQRKKPEPVQEPKPGELPPLSPVAKSWIDANQKIMKDRRLNPLAVAIHAENMESGMTEEQSFAKLTEQVRAEMPHKFENQRRGEPAAVGGASPPPRQTKKNGFDGLPDEAKQTFARLERHWAQKGRKYTKEEYATDYYLENPQ